MREGSYWSLEHVISRGRHWEPQLTILVFRWTTLYLTSQIFSEMDNSVKEHATEMREGSYWSQNHVLSLDILREPLLKFLAFSETDRYWDEIRIILKLGTCTFTWTTLGTSINDFSFFGEWPFTWSPKVQPKWITRSKNTLRRWEKDHIEAKNMYFHLAYLGNRY